MTRQELQQKALQWIQDNVGKSLDFDGVYGPQCVDEAQYYNRDVIGGPFLYGASAYNIADTYPQDFYDFVENTADNYPSLGDIPIWGTTVGSNGHIAVCKEGNPDYFISLDQNWNYHPYCEEVKHSYHGLLGWLTPKTQEPEPTPEPVQPAPEVVVTPTQIPVTATTDNGSVTYQVEVSNPITQPSSPGGESAKTIATPTNPTPEVKTASTGEPMSKPWLLSDLIVWTLKNIFSTLLELWKSLSLSQKK
jgi:hypothetical protein